MKKWNRSVMYQSFLCSVLLQVSFSANAELWKIGKYLTVSPPSHLEVTFQLDKEYDPKQKVIMGWRNKELIYAITVDEQPGGYPKEAYWDKTITEMKNLPDVKKLKLHTESKILTSDGDVADKRIYTIDGDGNYLIMYLIKNRKIAYWLLVLPADGKHLKIVSSDADAIVSTAVLTIW